ncbi:MAG: pantoate--beta-alanine ligase [Phycisphaerales bacterium]
MPSKDRAQSVADTTPALLTTVSDARAHRRALKGKVALVPTMGALHEGHLQHIRACRQHADHVIVSVFVNPTQFNEKQDYQKYPRTLEVDIRLCAEAGADAVFAPEADELYPPAQIPVEVSVPSLAGVLEGRDRPGHFQGVCRVVVKLLNIIQPDLVSFGRKDYQQLRVVSAVVSDLLMPVRILEIPTVREPDGLAMSSRNTRLTPEQRQRAPGLFKALSAAKQMVEQDEETDPHAVEQAMRAVLRAHQVEVGYTAVRHPQTLGELECIEPALTGGVIALVAGHVGGVRLIDNMLLGVQG